MKINTSLTELNLSCNETIWNEKRKKNENEEWIGNEIGHEGAKAMCESLKISNSLTTLNLEGDEKIRNEMREEKNELKNE